jgi:hypothetical protein
MKRNPKNATLSEFGFDFEKVENLENSSEPERTKASRAQRPCAHNDATHSRDKTLKQLERQGCAWDFGGRSRRALTLNTHYVLFVISQLYTPRA